MSDLITIDVGSKPWLPARDAQPLLELDRYNIPLAGLVTQYGATHLYVCAHGAEESVNIWLYAHVDEREVEAFDQARGTEVDGLMVQALRNRCVAAALADDWRIQHFLYLDAGQEPPRVLVRRYIKRLELEIARIKNVADDMDRDTEADEAQRELAFH